MVRQEGNAVTPSSAVDEEWMERVSVERRTTGAELGRGRPLWQWSGIDRVNSLQDTLESR